MLTLASSLWVAANVCWELPASLQTGMQASWSQAETLRNHLKEPREKISASCVQADATGEWL